MEMPPGAYPGRLVRPEPITRRGGPAELAGHVDWDGDPGVFSGLRTLEAGDQVLVDRPDGSTATPVVERVAECAKDECPVGTVYGDIGRAAADHLRRRLRLRRGQLHRQSGGLRRARCQWTVPRPLSGDEPQVPLDGLGTLPQPGQHGAQVVQRPSGHAGRRNRPLTEVRLA